MAICGFNQKMLEGLTGLTEGLVEHGLEYRCKQNNESIDQGIKREISDMTRLLLETNRIDDSAKRTITEGIVKYAMGFYLIMREKNIVDYKTVIASTMDYFKFMDDKYYSELEGKPGDMKQLAQLLNEKRI